MSIARRTRCVPIVHAILAAISLGACEGTDAPMVQRLDSAGVQVVRKVTRSAMVLAPRPLAVLSLRL